MCSRCSMCSIYVGACTSTCTEQASLNQLCVFRVFPVCWRVHVLSQVLCYLFTMYSICFMCIMCMYHASLFHVFHEFHVFHVFYVIHVHNVFHVRWSMYPYSYLLFQSSFSFFVFSVAGRGKGKDVVGSKMSLPRFLWLGQHLATHDRVAPKGDCSRHHLALSHFDRSNLNLCEDVCLCAIKPMCVWIDVCMCMCICVFVAHLSTTWQFHTWFFLGSQFLPPCKVGEGWHRAQA